MSPEEMQQMLLFAVEGGDRMKGVILELIAKGVDPNGDFYLHNAINAMRKPECKHVSYWEVIQVLLEARADPNALT